MPKFEVGDMWSIWGKTDLFCITTNSSINSKGELVMGRGIAIEARTRFPQLPKLLANQLLSLRDKRSFYYLLINEIDRQRIGAFQVKHHYNELADTNIIVESVGELVKAMAYNNFERVDLNYPGIGFGGLPEELVYQIIKYLPNYVHIWKYAA